MNMLRDGSGPSARALPAEAFVTAEIDASDPRPARTLCDRLRGSDPAHLFLFASPAAGSDAALGLLARELAEAMPGVQVTGCTTAGEIGAAGYVEGRIIAVALPAAQFATRTIVIEDLGRLDGPAAADALIAARLELAQANPGRDGGFAFLMVDGLSLREDELVGALAPALGRMPLFGGSAGDGTRFSRTVLLHEGRVLRDAALVTLVVTDYRTRVFSLNHLRATDLRMVVTGADPARRIVKEINAEPAGREYARIVGKDPDQLDEFTFAANPVVVRLGDQCHVRAIQRVNAAGELVFFSAIDEGMVLTVAEPEDMADHLDRSLAELGAGGAPAGILACDCILRRIEAEQGQQTRRVSDVLARHGVRGFSSYGEQIGPMHLNQTLTGVALFPPAGGAGG